MSTKSNISQIPSKELFFSRPTQIKRRDFLASLGLLAAASVLPSLASCTVSAKKDIHKQLSDLHFQTLSALQEHLFPSSQETPGAADVNAATYFTWVLSDPNKDADVKKSLLQGFDLLQQQCTALFQRPFTQLSGSQKETACHKLANTQKGQYWLSLILTAIFEALLSDPVYGGNTNEMGWKWLNHTPGLPRPTVQTAYKNIAYGNE